MKKLFLIGFFLFSLFYTEHILAQDFLKKDTLFVFPICNKNSGDTIMFTNISKGKKITWWDYNNQKHEACLLGAGTDYFILDSNKVPIYNVIAISSKSSTPNIKPGIFSQEISSGSRINIDGKHCVMTRLEYEKLFRKWKFNISQQARVNAMSKKNGLSTSELRLLESIKASFEKDEAKIAYSYAIRDSNRYQYDSLYGKTRYYSHEFNQKRKYRRYREYLSPHAITIGLFDPLNNQLTLTYSYRISRFFGLEISPGAYFSTLAKVAPAVPSPTYVEKCGGLNYHFWNNHGVQLNLTAKFYFTSRPNRYIGLKVFGRQFSYDRKNIDVYVLYHDSAPLEELQSETSKVLGFALLYGWQVSAKKLFTVDFFFGIGAYYRKGDITVYEHGILHCDRYNPASITYPYTFKASDWFPSFQGGVNIGFRFGKRKIAHA